MHLGAEGCAGLFVVEIREEGIIFAIEDSARVELLGENARERRFANTDWTFNGDITRRSKRGTGHREIIAEKIACRFAAWIETMIWPIRKARKNDSACLSEDRNEGFPLAQGNAVDFFENDAVKDE
jgi:hypothetical protein